MNHINNNDYLVNSGVRGIYFSHNAYGNINVRYIIKIDNAAEQFLSAGINAANINQFRSLYPHLQEYLNLLSTKQVSVTNNIDKRLNANCNDFLSKEDRDAVDIFINSYICVVKDLKALGIRYINTSFISIKDVHGNVASGSLLIPKDRQFNKLTKNQYRHSKYF